MTKSLLHLLYSMNQSPIITEKCLNTASLYLNSCGDGARIALIFMLLDIEIYSTDLSLKEALPLARKKQQIISIVDYVIDKMKNQGDQVEVALWLLLKLQETGHISEIGVDNMLYSGCANKEIFKHYGMGLAEAVTIINAPDPQREFEALAIIFPSLEEMFSQDFARIREKHTEQIEEKSNETSGQYLLRINQIQNNLYTELLSHVRGHIDNTEDDDIYNKAHCIII